MKEEQLQQTQLEGSTYEILQNRLKHNASDLLGKLNQLNESRKDVFGSIETKIIATERVTTENNCIPWDMVPIGNQFLFGYNVHIGLKTETKLSDVFSVYSYKNHQFIAEKPTLISDKSFIDDFKKLYKYYKHTQFVKFFTHGPFLHMVFRIGKEVNDVKTFKWEIHEGQLRYIDNRSDHEFKYPNQHDFGWTSTTREQHRGGQFPHISIMDEVFVETVGGDLTIKIEDNTESGEGIYSEPVIHKDQTLDDAEVHYAIVGNLIILKIKPYQEEERFLVYNRKIKQARRIDEIKESCILLPDDHGIIFTNGYYLQNGEYKKFENELQKMTFEKRIASPNGEDYLYVYYNRLSGTYLLLNYNLIEQKAENPTICHGFSLFENGEMSLFRSDEEPKKHHVVQIWQTPYVGPDFQSDVSNDSMLFKIGNKEIVRAMAESKELIRLVNKEDSYDGLYLDLIRQATDILDSYHWIDQEDSFLLNEPISEIKSIAESAIDEFEKVSRIRTNTKKQIQDTTEKAKALINKIKKSSSRSIDMYVDQLHQLRLLRGETISLKDLRYTDLEKIEQLENELTEVNENTSEDCVRYLLREESLVPYVKRTKELETEIEQVNKVVDADETETRLSKSAEELEMLIEIVSNLKIGDTTQTTQIVDNISGIYSTYNQLRAALRNKRKQLLSVEGEAEFNAQIKLVEQGVINFLDISDTPEKCDEYLTKLMVQLEELEGKFSEFDTFIEKISIKRDEIYSAFDSKKQNLIEQKNRRTNTLAQAGERILSAVKSRLSRFNEVNEINGYYASDLMIEKIRSIIVELTELGDTVKSEDIESKLKTIKEDAVRQLKDKSELFVDGDNLIKFGKHNFTVNTQSLDLTIIHKNDQLQFHLAGTNFFEEIDNNEIVELKNYWSQEILSENQDVYRGEYLAYKFLKDSSYSVEELKDLGEKELSKLIQEFMSVRYEEAYIKGVHDADALKIFQKLIELQLAADLIIFPSLERSMAELFWRECMDSPQREILDAQIKGAGLILQIFPESREFVEIQRQLEEALHAFATEWSIFQQADIEESALYLFKEISRGDDFVTDIVADELVKAFQKHLKTQKIVKKYENSILGLKGSGSLQFRQIERWVRAFANSSNKTEWMQYTYEAAKILFLKDKAPRKLIHVHLDFSLEGMSGNHPLIENGTYHSNYIDFSRKMKNFTQNIEPGFTKLKVLKKSLTSSFSDELRLNEFKPKIMSSFVRNKLIDDVYLPLIGNNLAKQIGAAGKDKRSDLMGMLLLISPPGYGKTTLMEYLANRLGIIFMKINGPAIGHDVVSVDPNQANNAGAREELNKLNLAFEMGDNVMIYLDDIQHCNPEFLQKFISLCDAQRKIEGVYKGKSKTYDFRGKKVCVVMAGNPYTESGSKFRIPDMLANRADIYNLGDIIGETADAFKMSYLENCLTSNSVLAHLQGKSHKDAVKMMQVAETGNHEGVEYEANHTPEEVTEYVDLFKKLIKVRDIILSVNMEYIKSAGQSDEYRTEPPFKLQGSYRDMNKITEKVVGMMNEKELNNIIHSHYESESQTLTSNAEANLLKFKQLINQASKQEKTRWEEILEAFRKKQELAGYGSNQAALIASRMDNISQHLGGIEGALNNNKE